MLVFLLSVVDELQMLVRLLFVVMHWVMVTRELLFWSVNNKNKFENLSLENSIFSCDKYWHCQDGYADLKTCGNGLGFLDTD